GRDVPEVPRLDQRCAGQQRGDPRLGVRRDAGAAGRRDLLPDLNVGVVRRRCHRPDVDVRGVPRSAEALMRVAALLPAATDIVIALGAGEQLVAVTHACTLPRTLAAVPRVTRSRVASSGSAGIDAQVSDLSEAGAALFDLDEAGLAAQKPDVILTQAVCEVCAVREEDARAVASRLSPLPYLATLGARTVDGILEDCLTVARALDIPEEGEELVLGLRSRIARV